ncbi:MAG TPA: cbb3-type cytochrome c oxidase N-terminal domain-containing protein [Kofleriaceae bacterium]|jgi:cytochrome c oxidase cbb3-type subunit 3|nr:cbb3-type cytochrome c oxidase N-terminal domain-containing protein [Kofleriaceae bacterium]
MTAANPALHGELEDADHALDDADHAPLLEHSYDGIREYDNPLPSWWSIMFGATIAFAFLYFAYYDIAKWGKSPAESYRVALAGWQATYKGGPGGGGGPSVTEDMLAAGADNPELVARGAAVFAARCVGCHGVNATGQIGPNLTDLFQLHGTTRMDLYATVLGGAPGTAMIAWGETLKPAEIVAVATFVSSLRGKNLPGKDPQGKPVPALAR